MPEAANCWIRTSAIRPGPTQGNVMSKLPSLILLSVQFDLNFEISRYTCLVLVIMTNVALIGSTGMVVSLILSQRSRPLSGP